MPLKETVSHLRKLLAATQHDLDKAERGYRAASKRVRTGSIVFAKIAKCYRKESVDAEKKGRNINQKSKQVTSGTQRKLSRLSCRR